MPTTLEELAALDQGLILIVGGRRSGKTLACQVILRCWEERNVRYRHFGHSDGPRRFYGGLPTSSTLLQRCRGYSWILVDEPDIRMEPEHANPFGVLVLATSNPKIWMTERASWIAWVADPNNEPFPAIRIQQGSYSFPPRPTLWERILNDWCI